MENNLFTDLLPNETSIPDTSLPVNTDAPIGTPSLNNNNVSPDILQLTDKIQKDTTRKSNLPKLSTNERRLLNNTKRRDLSDIFRADTGIDVGGFDVDSRLVRQDTNTGDSIAKFDTFTPFIDNEDNLAIKQSGWEQALNGVGKAAVKTLLNVVDGTVGTAVGLINGIAEGNLAATYNNGFSKWIDDMNTRMDLALPNYYTQEQRNMNFLESMGTVNFYANDVMGGMSFLLGTIGSEAIWAAATGGASLSTTLPRVAFKTAAKGILKTGATATGKHFYKNSLKLLKAYTRTIPATKTAQTLNNARFLYTSAGYESGVEARHSLNESMEHFNASYQREFGRIPNGEEYAQFLGDAVQNANKVFAANVALVGASNIAQFGTFFGLGTGLNKSLSKAVGRKFGIGVTRSLDDTGKLVYERIKSKNFTRRLGSTLSLLKSPITEGFVEEGGQGVISKTSQNWLAAKYDADSLQENFSAIEAASQAFEETYGTKEGFKEIGLGMIIGLIGDRGTRLKGEGSVFGNDFSDSLNRLDSNLTLLNQANSKMTGVQKDLINRLVKTNQFNAYNTKAQKEAKEGNLFQASLDWDAAQFSKLLLEDSVDLLDDSVADFKRVIEGTSNEALAKEHGIDIQQVGEYKAALFDKYTENVGLYKEAKEVAEAVNLSEFNLPIGKRDYTEQLALNIFLGVKAQSRAADLTESIDEFIGTNGVGSALRLYTNLTKRAKTRAERIVKLESELGELETQFAELQNSFTSTTLDSGKRKKENQAVSKKIIKNEKKRETTRERLVQKRIELEQLEGNLENRFYKGKFAFAGSHNAFKGSDTDANLISNDDIKNSVKELQQLDTYRELLGEQNPQALETLDLLIEDYLKNVQAFREFNNTFERMADPKFAQSKATGLASLFKEVGTPYNETNTEGLPAQLRVEAFEKYLEENKDNLDEGEVFTLRTLHNMSTAYYLNLKVRNNNGESDSIDNSTYDTFNSTGEVSEEVIGKIASKITENPEKPNLTKREAEIFNSNRSRVHSKVRDIKLEEGDDLSQTREATTEETDETLLGRLKKAIKTVKGSREYLKKLHPSEVNDATKPTNKEYKEYDSLFKQKTKGELTPKKIERLEELKQKINEWGRLEGTFAGKTATLSDLIEQAALLEDSEELTEDSTLPAITDLNDLVDSIEVGTTSSRDNYDNLQSYDKAFVTKDRFGNFVVSNINLNGILDLLSTSLNITVERRGKEINRKNEGWGITNLKEKQRFTVKFEVDGKLERVVLTIGEGNTLKISNSDKVKLNTFTNIKIAPSNNIPTNYQPLLREVTTEEGTVLLPVDSNFTFSDGLQMDNDAINNLKEDDLVYLEISTKEPFNKELLDRYEKATEVDKPKVLKEVEDTVLIYLKDRKNNLVGVHKAVPNTQSTNDPNLVALSKIRKLAVKRLLSENYLENQIIDVSLSIPVSNVYAGHPNLNIVKQEGKVVVRNMEFNKDSLELVEDFGYMLNGEIVLNGNTENVSTYPFAATIKRAKKYRGKRVPIVVVNHNGNKLAYPVTLKPTITDLSPRIDEIVKSNLSVQDKVLSLNKELIANGVNVNEYGFTSTNINKINIDRAKEELKQKKDYPNVKNWESTTETKQQVLVSQAMINVDLTNVPFHSPKIRTKITKPNGMDSEAVVDVALQESVPVNIENEINNEQNESCK